MKDEDENDKAFKEKKKAEAAALAEAKAQFTRYEINLFDKPAWYAPQVNPASKVSTTTDLLSFSCNHKELTMPL